jgi:hypothetical protein
MIVFVDFLLVPFEPPLCSRTTPQRGRKKTSFPNEIQR